MGTVAEASYDPDISSFLEPLASSGPLTIGVMVSSVDGRATVNGRVGDLTGPADQKVLLGAREMAAAVVVGGRTVRAEGYVGLLDDEAQARRRANGFPAEPELVIFTRASPSPPELWRQLRQRYPEGLIVCEGGPTLLGFVVEHGLLDQLLLCVSPQISGAVDEKRLIEHAGTLDIELELLAVTSTNGFLFLRYGARS